MSSADQAGDSGAMIEDRIADRQRADTQDLILLEGEVEQSNHDAIATAGRLGQGRRPVDCRHPVVDPVGAGEIHQAIIEGEEEGRALLSGNPFERIGIGRVDAVACQNRLQEVPAEGLPGLRLHGGSEHRFGLAKQGFQLGGEGGSVAGEGIDITPEGIDVAPQWPDLTPEGADIAVEWVDVAMEGVNVAVEGVDVAPEGADIAVEWIDIAPERADIAPER